MISLQISLIRIKFDSTFDARESNAAFVTCDSNQRWPLTFFDHTFDVAQRRFFVQCSFIIESMKSQAKPRKVNEAGCRIALDYQFCQS